MGAKWWVGMAVLYAATSVGAAGGVQQPIVRRVSQGRSYPGYSSQGYRYGQRQQSVELTIEQQRKLGLSDAQIQKIAEARRELEKERAKIEDQLRAARAAAAAANAEVTRLNQESRTILTLRLRKVYESVMGEEQLKKWKEEQFLAEARQYLRGYTRWLKLTDAQVEDIAQLLLPIYEKYDKMGDDLETTREKLAQLRRADKLDLAAIEAAEKKVAQLSKTSVYRERYNELREAMRAGLMPDQLEKFDRYRRR